jgi:AbiV family abortive infection protein
MPQPPDPTRLLYDNLFSGRSGSSTFSEISNGLAAIVENAEHLLDDAQVLFDSERFSRAFFLIATADEELAKSYILLEACRLDFNRHTGLLRRLCKAFYRHVEKYAYNQVFRDDIRDMAHAKEVFRTELQRWWPSTSYDSGEPDLPHYTYFTRDTNLYVDFIDYDQQWWIPSDTHARLSFSMLGDQITEPNPLSESQDALSKIKATHENGLFQPRVLGIINNIFRNCYIDENTSNETLYGLYDTVAVTIQNEIGITYEDFDKSALKGWPLYHFLQSCT